MNNFCKAVLVAIIIFATISGLGELFNVSTLRNVDEAIKSGSIGRETVLVGLFFTALTTLFAIALSKRLFLSIVIEDYYLKVWSTIVILLSWGCFRFFSVQTWKLF